MASAVYPGGDVMAWTKAKQEAWFDGYDAGYAAALRTIRRDVGADFGFPGAVEEGKRLMKMDDWERFNAPDISFTRPKKKKPRKLSKWQKFVKAKSKLPRFKYKTGKRKGMVNMKAVAAAWKKVPKSKK
jgi:hypothetical protein